MRIDIRSILGDPRMRKMLMVDSIITIQAREGIITSKIQAEKAYDKIKIKG